jgi:CheY-like chemotaxis protein
MIAESPVLLAEDEEYDVEFMQHAFKKAGVSNALLVVRDGQETIAYLEGQGKYADRGGYPEPFLLLLDLKLPILDGFDVLEWIQQRPRWRDGLLVIVLTSSGQEPDRKRALDLGAHGYLIKPGDAEGLVAMVMALKTRFLDPAASGGPEGAKSTPRGSRSVVR